MPNMFTIPKQEIPYLVGRKLVAAKIKDGFEDKSWAEYFTFLVNKTDITLQPNLGTALEEGAKHLFPMWMKNFAENVQYIRLPESHSISELAAPAVTATPKHSAIVIGRGPSVWSHKHLEMLGEAKSRGRYKGLVIASDGMLVECLKHNISPDLTVSVDGSILIKQWYDHPLVTSELQVALPATIDNAVYKTCIEHGCQIFWFMPMFDMHHAKESITKVMRAMTETPQHPDGLVMTSLGGNAGSAAWVFASFILKCAPVGLIGIDFGYPEGTKLQNTPYFSSMISKPADIVDMYEEVYHPIFKTRAYIDSVFTHYKEAFLGLQSSLEPWYLKAGGTINCTEGGCLWGRGIKCLPFKEFLSKYRK